MTSRGCARESVSHPRFHRSRVPGLKFSVTTCDAATSRVISAWPWGSLRSHVIDFLLRAEAAQIVADARLLDLDHLGAEFAEERRAERRGQIRREIEHDHAGERPGRIGHAVILPASC